jgi:hypothetical protein
MRNMRIEEGVIAVLLISKTLKFMKDSRNLKTSDRFMSSSFPYLVRSRGIVLRSVAKEKEAPAVEGSTPLTKKRKAVGTETARIPVNLPAAFSRQI